MPDPTPAILESARRFRQQLLARERRAASAMVRYYGDTWGRLQPEIRRLRGEVEEMRAAGEEVNPGRVNGLARLRSIEAQAQQQLLQFTEYADDAIKGAEREAIAAAERDAPALMRAAYPPDAPITIMFDRMPREAIENLVGFLQDGSPLADLLADVVQDAADKFGSTMVTGMAAGWNPRRLARALRSEFGMGLTQALKISRTEQLRAYRTTSLNAYRTSNVCTGWEWLATLSPRTCMSCLEKDGTRYSLDQEFEDHVQGRCCPVPITKSYAEMGIDAPEPDFTREKGHDWFLRQDEGVQRGILGDGKFDAWKDGQFKLEDVPKLTKSRIWGNSWTPKTLRELVPERKELRRMPELVTRAELQQWATTALTIRVGDLKGVQLSYAKEVLDTLYEIEQRLQKPLGIGLHWGGTSRGAYASYEWTNNDIYVKKRGDPAQIVERMRTDDAIWQKRYRTGVPYHSVASFKALIYHEYAHAIDDARRGQPHDLIRGLSLEERQSILKVSGYSGEGMFFGDRKCAEAFAESFVSIALNGSTRRYVPGAVQKLIARFLR